MTTKDRIEKIQKLITDNEYGPDSPIVQLLEICQNQQEEIQDLKKNIEWLTAHTKRNY